MLPAAGKYFMALLRAFRKSEPETLLGRQGGADEKKKKSVSIQGDLSWCWWLSIHFPRYGVTLLSQLLSFAQAELRGALLSKEWNPSEKKRDL